MSLVHPVECRLVLPTVALAASVRDAAVRVGDDRHDAYATFAGLADGLLAGQVQRLLADSRERSPRPEGFVPSTHLWWTDGTSYLGRVHVRHRLTPFLRDAGGHVGYHVVEAYRRQGHGTAMLLAALPVLDELGLDCALLTCDHDNVASRKIIETAGGLFHDRRGDKLRYWLPAG